MPLCNATTRAAHYANGCTAAQHTWQRFCCFPLSAAGTASTAAGMLPLWVLPHRRCLRACQQTRRRNIHSRFRRWWNLVLISRRGRKRSLLAAHYLGLDLHSPRTIHLLPATSLPSLLYLPRQDGKPPTTRANRAASGAIYVSLPSQPCFGSCGLTWRVHLD